MLKQISDKKKNRLASEWSEAILFMKRFNDLKHKGENYCMVTWCILTIDIISPASFPHILPKWKYPEFRYFKNNIWLVKWIKEHWIFDTYVNNYKNKYGSIKLEQDIKDWKEVWKDILNFNEWMYD